MLVLKCTLCDIYFVSMFLLELKHLRQMICGFPELDFFMYFSPELQMNLLWICIMYRETSERVLGIITIKIWTFWKKQLHRSQYSIESKSRENAHLVGGHISRHFDIPAKFQTSADLLYW